MNELYKKYLACTGDQVSAALLVLADIIERKKVVVENLDHDICMGLRKGLFGAQAEEGTDIRDINVDIRREG